MQTMLVRRLPATAQDRLRPLLALLFWYVLVGAILRLVLWSAFGRVQHVSEISLAWILAAGAVADTVQSLYFLAPFALFLWLAPDRLLRSRLAQALLIAGTFVWMFALGFASVAEYFFFEEFDARLNLVAVDYLMYPTEVVGDIRAEYPVVPVLLAVGVFSAFCVFVMRRYLIPRMRETSTLRGRSIPFATLAIVIAVCALTFETHTLAFSDNRVSNEIAANGASSFFRALRTNEIDYHTYYASRPTQTNLKNLVAYLGKEGAPFTRLSEGRLDRDHPGDPGGLGVAFFSHNHDVALYRNGELAILGLNKSVQNVFYDAKHDTYRPAPPNPELNDLAVAYYQTAFELFRARQYNWRSQEREAAPRRGGSISWAMTSVSTGFTR